jgi:glycosyltransferase involved in cell wall biosynthesis
MNNFFEYNPKKFQTQYNYKVLHVTPFFPPDKGGIADFVSNLCQNLSKQGNSITIIGQKRINNKIPDTDDGSENIIRINCIYLPGWPYPTLRSVSIPIDLGLKLDSLIRKEHFDIVHVHDHHYPICWLAINSAYKYGIPIVLSMHTLYALNPKIMGGKTVLEEWLNKHVFTKILAKTDAIIGGTRQVTDYAKEIGKQSAKYFTIPAGVNTHVYKENIMKKNEYRIKYNLHPDSIVILFVGRFEHVKGIIEFTNAVKNIIKYNNNKVEVVLVGNGSLDYYVQSILHGVDRVHLLKWQPNNRIHEIYITADIFVLPSRFEGLPLTIIEAMNAGLHIVYTPVGGIPDILQEYFPKTRLIATSSEEIQKTLITLLEYYSPSLQDRGSSFDYAQKFDWNNIASDVNKVYEVIRNRNE